ncbi:glycosyltransferase [Azospirillum sp. sgz302134]
MQDTVRKFLYFVGHTIDAESRSGVQRVVVNLARELARIADVDFVTWDAGANQLRYAGRTDLKRLFGSETLPPGVRINRFAHRVHHRFGDTLPADEPVWLIQPEIAYHFPNGNDVHARVVAQCREYGIPVAAVFYDLIPITNRDYASQRDPHTVYVNRLAQSDLILPISRYSAGVLLDHYTELAGAAAVAAASMPSRIVPLPLPDRDDGHPHPAAAPARQPDKLILSVGTVEPRKRQVQLVQAFKALKDGPLRGWKLVLVGALHPAVADSFRSLTDGDPAVDYHGYLSDAEIEELYRRAAFSVFASNDEGFGLPICESLARGVPAVCANFGSMMEIAEGGGCLAVDVNDQLALTRALERMATDPALRARLDDGIRGRAFRTWADYARELVLLTSTRDPRIARRRDRAALRTALRDLAARDLSNTEPARPPRVADLPLSSGTVQICAMDAMAPATGLPELPEDWTRVFLFRSDMVGPILGWPPDAAAALLSSDACLAPNGALDQALIGLASMVSFDGMLPGIVVGQPDRAVLEEQGAQAVLDLMRRKALRRDVRDRERMLLALGSASRPAYAATRQDRGPILTIAVSTYNRYPFVRENVRWLLDLAAGHRDEVRLLVVDNASTDQSWNRLRDEFGDRPVEIRRTCANVGMLGNLRVCAAAVSTPFVWMIGDDDFITPGAIPAVLERLREQPELPFLFLNFGVYHRERFGEADSAPGCIAERVLLAPQASPSGPCPVRRAAAEHDNLFTAIYPIVFRTDLAAACFNFPFTGAPFSNLVECVPTTRMIVGTYAEAPAYWMAETGIVGNAVNSWRHWRVRWHGAMMPEILALADEAGVDPAKLRPWSALHWDLFLEAKGLYPDARFEGDVGQDALDRAKRVFRRAVTG